MSDEITEQKQSQPLPLQAFIEALVDERFALLGGGALQSSDVERLQINHEGTQAIMNAVRQGRHFTQGSYPTAGEHDIAIRAFNIAKAYDYVLKHYIQTGKYVLNVNDQGGIELVEGNQSTRDNTEWAMKIARGTTKWKPSWEVEVDAEVTVRADTPEEALEKAQKGLGDLRIDSGMNIEMLATGAAKKDTLRLRRVRGYEPEDRHAAEWDQVEAKYSEYVRPRKQHDET